MFVRLAKISKDPAVRGSPDLQKFVDIMTCAAIERMPQFTPVNLCSVIWAASKLKKDLPQSGMFKTFLKAWAVEMEPHLEGLELDQLRKALAAITRLAFNPGPNWQMKAEAALTARLADGGAAPSAKTLACCLVSAASLGFFAAHPSEGFKRAVADACAAAFADGASCDPRVGQPAGAGRGREAARCVCSALWAAAVLGVELEAPTVQAMVSVVVAAVGPGEAGRSGGLAAGDGSGGEEGVPPLTPLDFAQVFWALSRLRHVPSPAELGALLGGTTRVLPTAPPELLATILWGLADLKVAPPESWLQLAYASFESHLDSADAEPLQALLHAAACLELPPPAWSPRLMQRLQDVDLRPLHDGNMVDLVTSMRALHLHPPPQLAHRLQDECIKRLAARQGAAAAPA